jgi:hypothetical protein
LGADHTEIGRPDPLAPANDRSDHAETRSNS